MKILLSFLLLPLALIFLTACGNILYLSKLGWHQSFITFHSVPIQEILKDERIDSEAKEKIHLIQEVKRYGEEKLGLRRTKSYSKYFELKGPVLYVVTASEKDRLQLHHWSFPIVGRVTYKSFFTQGGALKEERFLCGKGFDTFIQQVGAYSTLGWLKDPIFSSMIKWDDTALANLILHEMTHATVYFKGQTDFNEQMATFIGNRGAIGFLTERYGPGSKEVIKAIHTQEDDLLFAQWIDQSYQRLSNFYAMEISRDEKLRGREEIFQSIKEEFSKIKVQFKTDCYKDFEKEDLNNAVLLAYRRYIHQLEKLGALYKYFGQDLRRVIEFFKEVQASREEPNSFLERWMKEKGLTVPNYEVSKTRSRNLISYILQKPLRRQLPSHPLFFRQLIDPASTGSKLEPLSTRIDKKGNLLGVSSPRHPASLQIHKVFEEIPFVVVHSRVRNAVSLFRLPRYITNITVEPNHAFIQGVHSIST